MGDASAGAGGRGVDAFDLSLRLACCRRVWRALGITARFPRRGSLHSEARLAMPRRIKMPAGGVICRDAHAADDRLLGR